jgi:flagellar protein FlgJ
MAIDNAASMQSLNTWTDLSGFSALRQQAQADSKAALPVVAKQFESIFTQMVLKSMRDASPGDPLFQSQAGDAWQGMFDQQLSVSLSGKGHGLGIADMLIRQLGGATPPAPAQIDGTASAPATTDDWKQRLGAAVEATRSAGKAVANWAPKSAAEFVKEVAPYAMKAAEKLGVSLRAVLAQAALETQWGKHMPVHADGSRSNNLFGIKAGSNWNGEKVSVPTLEYKDGVAVRQHARLIGDNPRYAEALGKGDDVLGFARGLVSGSYATDPSYASKIAAIADSPTMQHALAALKNIVNLPTPSE